MATLGIFSVKVFHLHHGQYYTNGGFGNYLSEMCRSFDRVILLCRVRATAPGHGFYRVEHPNLEIVTVPALPTELGALLVQPVVLAKGLYVCRRSDVIHARMPDWTGVTGAVAARLTRRPCFHQIIGDTAGLARTIPLSKAWGLGAGLRVALLIYDWCERRVSRDQVVFAQGKLAFDKHVGAAWRYLVLSTAHSTSDLGTVTPRFMGARFRVLSVGRLQAVKNQQLLVRALAELRREDPRWELRIVGAGPKRDELRALAAELQVADHVTLVGELSHGAQLWDEYDSADVFVLPSVSEGTPKVILEAMARGCPVVASRVGGVPTAVVHEERGLLFEASSGDQLVSSLRRMAQDDALRSRCQSAAWVFSKQNTLEESSRFMLEQVVRHWPSLAPLRSV